MKKILHFNTTTLRYLIVGVAGVVFEIFIIFLMKGIFLASNELSITISFWLGIIFSFTLQKFFAFQNPGVEVKMLGGQIFAYGTLLIVNYLFTLFFVNIFSSFFGVYIARMIALIIMTCWNYIVYKKIIFNEMKIG